MRKVQQLYTARELLEQQIFDSLGFDESWQQAGTIAAAVYNARPYADPDHPTQPDVFVPRAPQRPELPDITPEEEAAIAHNLRTAAGQPPQ